jgi:hypothetical protein
MNINTTTGDCTWIHDPIRDEAIWKKADEWIYPYPNTIPKIDDAWKIRRMTGVDFKSNLTPEKFLDMYDITNFNQIESRIVQIEEQIKKLDDVALNYLNIKDKKNFLDNEASEIRQKIETQLLSLGKPYLRYLVKMTKKTQKDILHEDPANIVYINNPDQGTLLYFLKNDNPTDYLPRIVDHLETIPKEVQAAIIYHDLRLATFFDIDNDVFCKTVKTEPQLIAFVRNINMNMCIEAVTINKECYYYVPIEYLTQELELAYKLS